MSDVFCPTGFQFVDAPSLYADPEGRIVRIPAGLMRKRDLLSVLARGLNLPGYFGWNWDALENCLSSLEWIQSPRRIVLVHEGLPFQPDWENRATYLALLQDAAASWGPTDDHELIVVFPERCRSEVLAAT